MPIQENEKGLDDLSTRLMGCIWRAKSWRTFDDVETATHTLTMSLLHSFNFGSKEIFVTCPSFIRQMNLMYRFLGPFLLS